MSTISIAALANCLEDSRKIVFFTGEELSTEAGIRDFRSTFGALGKVKPEDIFTYQSLKKDPEKFYDFCFNYLYRYRDVKPGDVHYAMAQLEEIFPEKDFTIITQNFDGLHQKAGSTNVVELHGNLQRLRCTGCATKYSSDFFDAAPGVPRCECGHLLRPEIVMFLEDIPLEIFCKALEAMKKADLVVVVGSGLRIFPANTLLKERKKDVPLVLINRQPTEFDRQGYLIIHKKAGKVLRGALRYMSIRVVN